MQHSTNNITGSARVLTPADGAARLAAARAAIAANTVISDNAAFDPASAANASITPGIPDKAPASFVSAIPAEAKPVELTEGYVALGYQAGLNFIWSTQRRCVVPIDGNAITSVTLETFGGASWLFKTYGEKTQDGGTKLNLARARSDLIAACQRQGFYSPDQVKGSGFWYANVDGARTLVCNSGDSLFDVASRYVPRASRGAVFTEGRHIGMSSTGGVATDEDVRNLADLIDSFSWAHPSDSALVLGWIAIAPFSGVLRSCPILALQAPPESGKSALTETIDMLFGELEGCLSFNGVKTTAAGVTQELQADSVPVLLDEIFAAKGASKRDDQRIDSMLTLLRSAFNAGSDRIGQGSPSGKAAVYSSKFCAMIASRTFPDLDDQDRSRMALCKLYKRKSSAPAHRLFVLREELLKPLGRRVKQRMFLNWSKFEETAANVKQVLMLERGRRERFYEVFGQCIAGWYVLMTGRAASIDEARLVIDSIDLNHHLAHVDGRSDERDCADWLTGYVPAGSKTTVGEMLREALDGNKVSAATLEAVGLKLAGSLVQICAVQSYAGIRAAFADSKWAGGGWASILEQAPNAKACNPRFGGKTRAAVAVPVNWLLEEPEQTSLPL